MSPLSVGNGHFCYTADITGMQTFPGCYREGIPLNTMSEWEWHSFSNTEDYKLADTFIEVDSHGRKVKYPINTKHPGSDYLRSNPHQITLGLIGLQIKDENGDLATLEKVHSIDQTLNLWQGILFTKNTYLPNGHNYQRDNLKIYLPGNGGLLTAIAMMCAGWDGAPDNNAPGFPDNSLWKVKWEGLKSIF